ncbi:MAG: MAPEG family protein [Gammaproteobacteria bacterium]|nr:MAPEG family protein [Gammaproteobacteria bacterium]
MSSSAEILQPVMALLSWTALMWAWMYATRIPAISKLGLKMDGNVPSSELMNQLPPAVRWKADNYNHLLEQPTLFYAIALSLAVIDVGSGANLLLAWAYVGLRVVHSLVQVLGNKIMLRFGLFVVASLVLYTLLIRAVLLVFA